MASPLRTSAPLFIAKLGGTFNPSPSSPIPYYRQKGIELGEDDIKGMTSF